MTLVRPKNRQEAFQMIEEMQKTRQELRQRERAVKARMYATSSNPVIASDDLRPNLIKALPPHLVPKNVGDLGSIMWDFFFSVELDFGTDPVFDSTVMLKNSFRVDQEASLLLCGVSRSYEDLGPAGKGAPILITLRDAQSTRQFNDVSFPIQNFGEAGLPTMLDTPLLLSKNATFMVEASSWIPDFMPTTGNGKQELVFFGLRVRDEDNVKTLASLFL